MKKIILLALSVIVLAGCNISIIDNASVGYYTWINASSHTITLAVEGGYANFESTESDKLKIILAPNERYNDMKFGIIPPGVSWKKMTVLFDDGEYGWTFGYEQPRPENYNRQYDPTLEYNYLSEVVKNPEGCSQCAGNRWTYTFTDADYDAATQYGPRPQEPEQPAE
jgi:hypothetical protein